MTLKTQIAPNTENEPRPVFPVPTDRQWKWQQTEFYAFFHYGMNTYTGKEWGNGDEDVNRFAPTAKPDPRQWLEAVKEAGMTGRNCCCEASRWFLLVAYGDYRS